MIYAFTGKTGSGKTYKMIQLARRHWLRGTTIYSNTVLRYSETDTTNKLIRKIFKKNGLKRGKIIYFNELTEILEAKNGIIIFDEAQVLFNARNWEALPNEFQYKLQQHRKHKLDLYCTTQNMGAIDITYRRLVQRWFHCEDKFAILFKRNPSWCTIHLLKEKDVDQLYNSVDDLTVDTIRTRIFFIGILSKRIYDTFYDIGFKRFQVIWLRSLNILEEKKKVKVYIIPKNKSLKSVLAQVYSLKSALGVSKSAYLKKN